MILSIIVPVYNGEHILYENIEKVCNCLSPEMEVIIVNDGSTDGTINICKRLADNFSCIKIVDKENGGVSAARNAGIDISCGDYIAFMDADDYYEVDSFERILNLAKKNDADVAIWGTTIVNNNNSFECVVHLSEDMKLYCNDELKKLRRYCLERNKSTFNEFLTDGCYGFRLGGPCSKIYKKSILNNIRFNEKLNICEDLIFVNEVLKKAEKVVIYKESIYRYLMNDNSATHFKFNEKRKDDYLNLAKEYYKLKDDYDEEYEISIYKKIIRCCWDGIKLGIVSDINTNERMKKKAIIEYINNSIYSQIIKKCKLSYFENIKSKVQFIILKFRIVFLWKYV